MHSARFLMAIAGFTSLCGAIQAADFCAGSGTEIRQALLAAEDNDEADTINILTGTYSASTGTVAFPYSTSQSHALTIEGGYGPGCGRRRDRAHLTVLSGSDVRQVMNLFSSGSGAIRVKNLTIEGGNSDGPGGGMSIGGPTNFPFPPFAGNITVERVIFKFNRSATTPGGLAVNTGDGSIVLRGNLFVFNRCSDSNCSLLVRSLAAGSSPIPVIFAGNTVALNTCNLGTAPVCDSGGARFTGHQQALIYDNLFAFHSGEDLSLQTPEVDADLYYNNIEALVGSPSVEVGTLTESNPEFVDALAEDFRLLATSPVRNQGNAPYPLPGIDLDGKPRIVESAPDLGAYEYQEFLFDDGFEEEP